MTKKASSPTTGLSHTPDCQSAPSSSEGVEAVLAKFKAAMAQRKAKTSFISDEQRNALTDQVREMLGVTSESDLVILLRALRDSDLYLAAAGHFGDFCKTFLQRQPDEINALLERSDEEGQKTNAVGETSRRTTIPGSNTHPEDQEAKPVESEIDEGRKNGNNVQTTSTNPPPATGSRETTPSSIGSTTAKAVGSGQKGHTATQVKQSQKAAAVEVRPKAANPKAGDHPNVNLSSPASPQSYQAPVKNDDPGVGRSAASTEHREDARHPTPDPVPAEVRRTPPSSIEGSSAPPDSKSLVLRLSDIKVDPGIQSRASISRTTVKHYAERMEAGDQFQPPDVFDVDGEMLLADGFHRYEAHQIVGHTSALVIVHTGSRRDAIKFGIEANSVNGMPYSNADKRRAVKLMFENFPGLSDGAYAQMCKVSQPFVSKLLCQLKTVMSCETRTGRDGKRRKPPQKLAKADQHGKAAEKADDVDAHCARKTEDAVEAQKLKATRQYKRPPDEANVWRRSQRVVMIAIAEAAKLRKDERNLFWEDVRERLDREAVRRQAEAQGG